MLIALLLASQIVLNSFEILFHLQDLEETAKNVQRNNIRNRSLGALRAPTSSWRPFGPLDVVLRALRALRPCDPRHHPSRVNTKTRANTITQPTP